MTNSQILARVIAPFTHLLVAVLRLCPARARVFFFKSIRAVFNPLISEQLFEEAFSKGLKRPGTEVQVEWMNVAWHFDAKLSLDLGDYIQRRFFLFGCPEFMPELLCFCDPSTLFFDIGANIGVVSLGVATRVPAQNIHAFEPIPETYARMMANFRNNRPAIAGHNLALSNADGELRLGTINTDSGSATVDTAYLQDRLAANRISAEMQFVTCPMQKFDTFWETLPSTARAAARKIAVKVDVEGHEMEVLEGMEGFLRSTSQEIFLICETHFQHIRRIKERLESHGFRLLGPPPQVLESQALFGSAKDLTFHRHAR